MSNNKTSKKYEGVRSKELNNGDIAYYVRLVSNGIRKEIKVGSKNTGWNEKKAYLKRLELLNTPQTNNKITMNEIMDRYLQFQELHLSNHKTIIDYKGQCLNHIKPFFGEYSLNTINAKMINDFMILLKENGKSNKTINKLIERLRAIIDFAIKEYQLSIKNVAKDIKKLRIDNARERFLTKEEIDLLLKVAKNESNKEIYLFFVLAFSTGARLNSIRNIRLSHIDFESGVIKMQDFKNNSKYSSFLTPQAKEALKDYKQEILFATPERTITRNMQRILNELFNKDIDLHDRKQRVVIHTTRHTFASHLAIRGTPIHIIQKLLNHKDIKMTMRYAHLLPSSGKEYVENLWG